MNCMKTILVAGMCAATAMATEPQMSAEGWSVSRLENEFRMNAIAALLTIDWLRKEPGKALAALNEGFK